MRGGSALGLVSLYGLCSLAGLVGDCRGVGRSTGTSSSRHGDDDDVDNWMRCEKASAIGGGAEG